MARPVDFTAVRLDLGVQEPFFARVYDAVRRLGWGETTTYGAVAQALGAGPETARDVGQAMARNPVPLIVPCHRVLAAGGKVGGFSAPGGASAKRRMLALEGVRLDAPPRGRHPSPSERSRPLSVVAARRYEWARGRRNAKGAGAWRSSRGRSTSARTSSPRQPLIRLTVDLHRRAETPVSEYARRAGQPLFDELPGLATAATETRRAAGRAAEGRPTAGSAS